jgi:hypothetical protein
MPLLDPEKEEGTMSPSLDFLLLASALIAVIHFAFGAG